MGLRWEQAKQRALTVQCPACDQLPGDPCVSKYWFGGAPGKVLGSPHTARASAAARARTDRAA